MKPWFESLRALHDMEEGPVGRPEMLRWAGDALREAEEAIRDDDLRTLILIDLGGIGSAQVMAMPVRHRHGQTCGRA